MLEFYAAIFLMLGIAKLFGEIARRGKQPSLVGELLAGVLIGGSILNLVQPTGDLTVVTNLSLFFIMFLTGLNLDSKDIAEVGWRAVVLSLPGFLIPFVVGYLAAAAFGLDLRGSLAVGLTLSITAVPVNSIILMDLGILKTKLGTTVLTAGVIDNQLALIALGIVLQLPVAGSSGSLDYTSIGLSVVKVIVFVGAVMLVDRLLRKNPQWVRSRLPKLEPKLLARESGLAILLVFGIGVSLLAEALGLNFIIGAYFAGILVKQAVGDLWLNRSRDMISGVTFGIFAPLLFAFIGIQLNFYAVGGVALLFIALLAIAVVGKLVGGYAGARLGGFSAADSGVIGALLNSRGMVELVIASIVYQAKLIDLTLFSVVVAIGIITTITSGVMARVALKNRVPE